MALSIQSHKLFRGIILTVITIFMIHLIVSDGINFLVSPIIAKIIGVSIIPLSIISLTTLFSSILNLNGHTDGLDHHHPIHKHEHEHVEEDGHNHLDHKSFWYRMTIGLMLLFIVLSVTWHPSTLGTTMISGQSNANLSTSSVLSRPTASLSQPLSTGGKGAATQEKGPSIASIAFKYNQNPNNFIGKQLNLIGFVYHPNGLPKNQFILTRFFIYCCIADAIPIGMPVEISNSDQLKSDTWVQLSGTIKTEQLPGLKKFGPTKSWVPKDKNQPVLIAHSIKVIPIPQQPYMYPDF